MRGGRLCLGRPRAVPPLAPRAVPPLGKPRAVPPLTPRPQETSPAPPRKDAKSATTDPAPRVTAVLVSARRGVCACRCSALRRGPRGGAPLALPTALVCSGSGPTTERDPTPLAPAAATVYRGVTDGPPSAPRPPCGLPHAKPQRNLDGAERAPRTSAPAHYLECCLLIGPPRAVRHTPRGRPAGKEPIDGARGTPLVSTSVLRHTTAAQPEKDL